MPHPEVTLIIAEKGRRVYANCPRYYANRADISGKKLSAFDNAKAICQDFAGNPSAKCLLFCEKCAETKNTN